jgi:ADP-ribose pyrophosphatase
MVSAPGFSDEGVRIYLATDLTDVGRPDAHDEEADLLVRWFSLEEARRMVLAGDIVNSIAIAGILAAHDVEDPSSLRTVDAPWVDRSKAFARRQAEK